MIFADKLILLRKKSGLSQEELAEKLDVTRQAVSKWEGAQSIPALDKILQLSALFGVSTDYLLRDELEEMPAPPAQAEPPAGAEVRRVSMEDASAFLAAKEATALPFSLAVLLCILSPVPLLALVGASASRLFSGPGESLAAGLGLVALLALVACAVAVFLWCNGKTGRFAFLETEEFETAYGVSGMVRARQEKGRGRHLRLTVLGTVLCVLSPVPLLCGAFLLEDVFPLILTLCGLLVLAGAGAFLLVLTGTPWEAMEQLLEEGDYTRRGKRTARATRFVAPVYWMTVLAVYLAYSFLTRDYRNDWIIWPVAGVLFVPVLLLSRALAARKD